MPFVRLVQWPQPSPAISIKVTDLVPDRLEPAKAHPQLQAAAECDKTARHDHMTSNIIQYK